MKLQVNVEDGKDVFFTSDYHWGHKNVIRFDNRPFLDEFNEPDIKKMHETLLLNWNSVVKENDVVFYLGDLSLGNPKFAKEFVDKLNGEINFVMGNHDRYSEILKMNRFKTIYDLVDLKIFNPKDKSESDYVLCHYPIHSWNRAHHGTYMIHGHSHMSLSEKEFHQGKRIFDLGCNGWNYTPVSYKEILKRGEHLSFKNQTHH